MCGIAGYIGNKPVNEEKFNKMVDIVSHRGPNDRGIYVDGNISLGHRRLSIFDLSDAGHQPFEYGNRYVITYNGEVYNFKEIKQELIEKGYSFRSETDTEVVIASYDHYGKECVKKFNGMWAFAIYDKKKNEVFISRDRFGVKPFYYSYYNDTFLFGSEIKQLLCYFNRKWDVNKKRMLEYLIRGYSDYTEETMIDGIYQLRGGCNLLFDVKTHNYKIERYYDLEKIAESVNSYDKACDVFRTTFENSVKMRIEADVPVGYCLSGGLDSSAIVTTADKIIKQEGKDTKQTSISSCFEEKEYDEQEYIDEVLKSTNVNGIKIFPKGDNLLEELDKLIWHMDEPFSSTSVYAQYNVFKGAKENGLTVMLDGQGADEQLAGYTGFYSVLLSEHLRHFRLISFVKELRSYIKLRASTEQYVSSKKIIAEAFIASFVPIKLQKYAKVKLFYNRRPSPFNKADVEKTIMGLNLYPANNSQKYIIDNLKCNLSMLLRYEDRNSMAFSIESRVPFLDYNLVETVFNMPISYKIKDGITKRILRDAIDLLPEKISHRYSKLGFVTPEDKWINDNPEIFRKELKEACKYLSPLVNKEQVMKWYDSVAGKVSRMDYTAFRIICAGRWVKIFNINVDV